jgi:hypothetical protein
VLGLVGGCRHSMYKDFDWPDLLSAETLQPRTATPRQLLLAALRTAACGSNLQILASARPASDFTRVGWLVG